MKSPHLENKKVIEYKKVIATLGASLRNENAN